MTATLGAWLYAPTFEWLWWVWSTDRAFSHGFLVPLVSAYLVWIKREQLRAMTPSPRPVAGGFVVLGALALLAAGRFSGFTLAEAVSLLVLLPGAVLWVWGWDVLKATALPLFYLQFMVPWFEEFLKPIQWVFQLVSAHIGVWMLRLTGIPVFLDRVYIYLPNATLEVARECSGLNFVISVLALALPLVYLTQRSWRRAGGVLAGGVVLTVVANSVRVAVAGFMAHRYGVEMLHGPGHIFRGWFAAQLGFVLVFVLNWVVARVRPPEAPRLYERWQAPAGGGAVGRDWRRPMWALVAVLAAAGAYLVAAAPRPVPLEASLAAVPTRIGPWLGRADRWIDGEAMFPGVDDQLARTYRRPGGGGVSVYVAYFERQAKGKKLVNFRADSLRRRGRTVAVDLGDGAPTAVLWSWPELDGRRYEALLWYALPSGVSASRYAVKIRSITDALLYRRNNGAAVVLARPAGPARPGDGPSPELLEAARALWPLLDRVLP